MPNDDPWDFADSPRHQALAEVEIERVRQDRKWGEQSLPDGSGGYQLVAKSAQESTDYAAKNGTVTWRHILLEEVYEALAETDRVRLKNELIQVAAVAVAWVENIIRDEERKAVA